MRDGEKPAVHGSLFVVSAPSGGGKRTVLRKVLDRDGKAEYGVSATTRPPRPGEVEGQDYFFLSQDEFQRRIKAGEFVEWADVHGNLYGTLRSELKRVTASGRDVFLELDVQGMRNLRNAGIDAVSIFIMPPSLDALEARLRGRGTNDERDIAVRMRNAEAELDARKEFDYVVINDDVDTAVADVEAIVRARRLESARQP
ncbi:MAG: guanylate kinase [Candidatus Hydrogenedentes bacterium]|nr:guanylate kinase [Candidatus Hydrogenedentota bacterium]